MLRRIAVLALVLLPLLPAPRAAAQGVTLFRDKKLRGPSQTFTRDEPELARTRFGAGRASSIAVPRGCTAELFDRPWYHGRSTVFHDDDNDLSNTEVGEDTAASIRVDCGGDEGDRWERREDGRREPGRGGVTLFRDRDLEGPSEFFDRDVPDLGRTRIGARTASSVDVTPGCVATLFEKPGFRGRWTEFKERDNNLKNTSVGEDTVSSLQIRCGGDARR